MATMALRLAHDPVEDDAFVALSGVVAMRSSPKGPGVLARALGRDASRGTRYFDGDRTGPFFRALELVRDLSRSDDTTPYALLTEATIVAKREALNGREAEWMVTRYREAEAKARAAEAARDVALLTHNRSAHRQAMRDAAAALTTMVALDEALHALPGQPDPRGAA